MVATRAGNLLITLPNNKVRTCGCAQVMLSSSNYLIAVELPETDHSLLLLVP